MASIPGVKLGGSHVISSFFRGGCKHCVEFSLVLRPLWSSRLEVSAGLIALGFAVSLKGCSDELGHFADKSHIFGMIVVIEAYNLT